MKSASAAFLPAATAPSASLGATPPLTGAVTPRAPAALSPGFASRLNLVADLALLVLVLAVPLWGRGLAVERPGLALLAVGAWALLGVVLGLYEARISERAPREDLALRALNLLGVLFPLIVLLPEPGEALRRVLLFWLGALALRQFVFRPLVAQEPPLDEVIILGTGPLGRHTGEALRLGGRRRVLGYLRFADEARREELSAPELGTVAELERVLRMLPVAAVYVAGNTLRQGAAMQEAVRVCERFGVPFALPAQPFRLSRAHPVEAGPSAEGFVHYASVEPRPHQQALKRLMDVTASAVALLLLVPLFAAVALAIRLTSRGPLFFKQMRVGQYGRLFPMFKFRSMVVDAEALKERLAALNEQTGPVFKMKNDPRITRVGRFIRKYSIDELPQLLNVLLGDMSLVGPRPPVPSEVARYEPWQRRRLSVLPGLTCIWQVSGRNRITFEDWMYMDMRYIDHWSLKQDISLLLRTVPVVVTGRGAS